MLIPAAFVRTGTWSTDTMTFQARVRVPHLEGSWLLRRFAVRRGEFSPTLSPTETLRMMEGCCLGVKSGPWKDDELSYALGKQGGTRKKLERASGPAARVESVGGMFCSQEHAGARGTQVSSRVLASPSCCSELAEAFRFPAGCIVQQLGAGKPHGSPFCPARSATHGDNKST